MLRELPHPQEPARSKLRLCTTAHNHQPRVKTNSAKDTHVLSNSGNGSSFESLLFHGNSTKLIFTVGTDGILFTNKYSSSQNGITSSSTLASCPVLDTCPR